MWGLRCFIAIEMPDDIKTKLGMLQEELKRSGADIKWVEHNNIHLTVKFLGSVGEKDIPQIVNIMQEICKKYKPFDLEIKGIGMFPVTRHPRLLWVGAEADEVIGNLQREIEQGMTKVGIKEEDREFTPHLTLGRFKTTKGKESLLSIIDLHKKDSFGILNVSSIALMRSDLSPSGARYSRVAEVALG